MQQFKALFKKELSGYFKSSFAYFIFFIYLFVSIGGAFYFGSYLAMHDTSVYALFYLQPIILSLLIPALTMRLWSEEYKSGTAEFLLTQPVLDKLPVIAKVSASVFLAVLMSLFLLPFIIYTASWLEIDWGNVVCCYLGVWLYILLFCSLGCFISSLSKYTIVSYLLTVFVGGLWLLMPITRLNDIYNNFLFAEVGISDFTYFLIFTACFICLNILVLDYIRSVQKNKGLQFFLFSVLLVIGIIALNTAFGVLLDGYKADFTSARQYTLRPVSRELIDSITKPISVDVYISKDLRTKNAEYYHYYQQTKRFIEKYQKNSASMISVNITEVEPFSELEKKVLAQGLYYEENLKGTKDYFGAIIRDNEGQGEVIKQFLPQRWAFLEKDIDKTLLKLTRSEVIKSIGVYFDPRQNIDLFNGFALNLEEDYNVLSVTEDTYEISSKLDLLILVNPKEMPISFLYAVDQYIANGGKVIIFLDLLTRGQADAINLQTPQAVIFMDQMKVLLGVNMVDEGTVVDKYKVSGKDLELYKALTFKADEGEFEVKPVILNENGFIGAVLKGRYKSAFKSNPHQSKEVLQSMMPQTLYGSEQATVAFIGDADIIEDYSWIDENSPDDNPYSTVYRSANMEVIRTLVDELIGNDIYNNLPQNGSTESVFGIGEQINSELYEEYKEEYNSIIEDMRINKLKLIQLSGGNEDKLQVLLQSDEAGLQLGQAEQKMESLLYKIRKQYSTIINTMILICVLLWPLTAVAGIGLIIVLFERRRLKKIKEMLNE